jgi:hypothetical protein
MDQLQVSIAQIQLVADTLVAKADHQQHLVVLAVVDTMGLVLEVVMLAHIPQQKDMQEQRTLSHHKAVAVELLELQVEEVAVLPIVHFHLGHQLLRQE